MGYIDFLTCIHSKFFTLRLPTKSFVFHFSDFSLKSLRECFQNLFSEPSFGGDLWLESRTSNIRKLHNFQGFFTVWPSSWDGENRLLKLKTAWEISNYLVLRFLGQWLRKKLKIQPSHGKVRMLPVILLS